MRCASCGKETESWAPFCMHCGASPTEDRPPESGAGGEGGGADQPGQVPQADPGRGHGTPCPYSRFPA